MIGYIKGKIINAKWGRLIVETGGVGYRVSVDPQIKIPENCVDIKYEVELFIYEHIREDCHDLYGFLTYQELETFERLISVSGVGPKAGLNIMSSSDCSKIYSAIESSDVSFFTAVPGIGKKVASKIILELRSKISEDESKAVLSGKGDENEVIDALIALGFKKSELGGVINKIPASLKSPEDKIKWVLKKSGQDKK